MLDVIRRCFPQQAKEWEPKIKEMIPSYGTKLLDHPELIREIHESTSRALGLVTKQEAHTA